MNRVLNNPGPTAPLSDVLATAVVAGATWRELARRRRLLSLGLLLMIPVLMLLAVRIWAPQDAPPNVVLPLLARYVYIMFLLPITAMAVGAPAISEPIAEGTLVYFWTRPIRRHALYLGRIVAAAIVSCGLVLLSQTAVFMVMLAGWPDQALSLDLMRLHAETTVVTLLGTVAYTALFGAFGAGLKKPMVAAILFAFGWEATVTKIPQRIQEWTLQFHLGNLVHWPEADSRDVPGLIENLLNLALQREPVPAWESVVSLLVVSLVATVAGVLLLRGRQLDKQG